MKIEVDKLNINKLVNVPTGLNNSNAKGDDLDVGKLKTVPIDLKKLIDVVCKEPVKNTKFNTLKAKVNNLIHKNQFNTDRQNVEKKIGDVDKTLEML